MKTAVLLFVLFALSGCSGKAYALESDANADSIRTSKLYVVGHGWHVGLVIAAEELNPMLPDLEERFG